MVQMDSHQQPLFLMIVRIITYLDTILIFVNGATKTPMYTKIKTSGGQFSD